MMLSRDLEGVGLRRQVHRSEIFGEGLREPVRRLAELGGLDGIGAGRIARILPLAQQVAPNVSEIRIGPVAHGAPPGGGSLSCRSLSP
jgi:hypothetical protein